MKYIICINKDKITLKLIKYSPFIKAQIEKTLISHYGFKFTNNIFQKPITQYNEYIINHIKNYLNLI